MTSTSVVKIYLSTLLLKRVGQGGFSKMDSSEVLRSLVLPGGIGIAIIVVAILLRRYLYAYVRKIASRTRTKLDDVMIHETRASTLLWCIFLGIFAGYKIANTPQTWVNTETKIVLVLFAALGVYTVIVIITAALKWYREEICSKTSSNIDDIIMGVLIVATRIVGSVLGIILILKLLGIENQAINDWISQHLVSLATLTVIAVVLFLSTMTIIPKITLNMVRKSRAEQTEEEMQKRSDTLIGVLVTTLQVVIFFIYLVMVLSEFNFNITAILTGAGVLGLAIGFGAQSLVKDLIAGVFVIVENQYRNGDVVKIADTSGVVEEINLRRTILRDMDGVTHVVPNGEIRIASNFTKQWSRVNLDISVSYDTDLDKAMAVINRVGKELAEDPVWSPAILTPPKALRINKLGDSGIDIKVLGDTKATRQWDVMGELRLRLKKAFDQEGIEIPYPHTKVYFGNVPGNPSRKDIDRSTK
jgi:moderate conductance mechanosensitive channel